MKREDITFKAAGVGALVSATAGLDLFQRCLQVRHGRGILTHAMNRALKLIKQANGRGN